MKLKIIKIIKSNSFLYGIAKRTYRLFNINNVNKLKKKSNTVFADTCYLGYILKNINDLSKIKDHYNSIRMVNKHLLIFLSDNSFDIHVHSLFEDNSNISFISIDYMTKYNKSFNCEKLIILDHNNNDQIYRNLFQIINRRD